MSKCADFRTKVIKNIFSTTGGCIGVSDEAVSDDVLCDGLDGVSLGFVIWFSMTFTILSLTCEDCVPVCDENKKIATIMSATKNHIM